MHANDDDGCLPERAAAPQPPKDVSDMIQYLPIGDVAKRVVPDLTLAEAASLLQLYLKPLLTGIAL